MKTMEILSAPAVRALPVGDAPEAAALLFRAFGEYPLVDYMFEGQPAARRDAFRGMFQALIESRLIRRWPVLAAWSGERLAGVAVITAPDDTPGEEEADLLIERAAEAIGPEAMARFEAYADLCDVGLPDWPHHYLGILGVDPEFRGQHLGRALLEATQSLVREHPLSRGIVLNTESPQNLPYYKGSGFNVVHEEQLDWITTWSMTWRQGLFL